MANDGRDEDGQQRLPWGYERLMQRARDLLGGDERGERPGVDDLLHRAAEAMVEVGEITRIEAERIVTWLGDDLRDAAQHMRNTGKDLREWMRFDMDLMESRLRERMEVLVDHTREELDRLGEEAKAAREVRTGEVVGPGTLFCQQCGQAMTLKASGHVPPCPKCHGVDFARAVPHRA